MSEAFNALLKSFDQGIEKQKTGSFTKEDVKEIYKAASSYFDVNISLDQSHIEQIRDKWIELANGKIDKGNAMKKLQGTSRAEAIQSVLLSSLSSKSHK